MSADPERDGAQPHAHGAAPATGDAWLVLLWAVPVCIALWGAVATVADYNSLNVGGHELADHLPYFTRNGTAFTWSDLAAPFGNLDGGGESRPRFIAYAIVVLDLKLRLWLYQFFPVHPTASLSWLLTIGLGLPLIFGFVRELTGSWRAGAAALAIQASSIGFLSGLSFLFMPGKPLTNVVFVAAFWLALRCQRAARGGGLAHAPAELRFGLAGLLFAGLFLDEVPAFLFVLLPLAWPALLLGRARPLWWRDVVHNAAWLLAPALAFAIVAIGVVPALHAAAGVEGGFDFLGSLRGRAEFSYRSPPLESLLTLLASFGRNLAGLAGTSWIPDAVAPLVAIDANGNAYTQRVGPLQVGGLLALVALGAAAARAAGRFREFLRWSAVLVAFVALQTLLQHFHVPLVNGYFYGCAFAVVGAVWIGQLAAALDGAGRAARSLAPLLVAGLVVVQLTNFWIVNDSWVAPGHAYAVDLYRERHPGLEHPIHHPAPVEPAELRAAWQAWRDGALDAYLRREGASSGTLHMHFYLRRLDGWTPNGSGESS